MTEADETGRQRGETAEKGASTLGSLSEYARHIGRTPQYVAKLKDQQRLVLVDVGGVRPKVDFRASDVLIRATTDEARTRNGLNAKRKGDAPVGSADLPLPLPPDPSASRLRASHAKQKEFAAGIAEIEFNKKAGRYVEKAAVELGAFEAFRTLRDEAMTLPSRYAGDIREAPDLRSAEMVFDAALRELFAEFDRKVQERIRAHVDERG